ncbi:MAG TPA: acyltransferase [Rhodocyclaceae bacterium]|nr:acyltransferase [Rhodocyclaceae bacterium]
MKPGASGRFDEIDMMRGIAALCVVASHYTSYCVRYLGGAPIHVPLEYGFYAVKLFFTISGFVIYFTLDKSRTVADFAFSRFARLYPGYIAALSFMMFIETAVFGERMWWGGYVVNLTMLQEYFGFPNLDNVFWSLTVELAFYLQMSIILWSGAIRRIEHIALAWILVACGWKVATETFGIQVPDLVARLYLFEHVPYFMAGIAFYLIDKDGWKRQRLAVLFLAACAEWYMHGTEGLLVASAIFAVFAMAVAGWLRFLVNQVSIWFGAISYSLYISHRNLGYSSMQYLHEQGVTVGLGLTVVFGGALLLATAIHYAVERPVGRRLTRWYKGRSVTRGARL